MTPRRIRVNFCAPGVYAGIFASCQQDFESWDDFGDWMQTHILSNGSPILITSWRFL